MGDEKRILKIANNVWIGTNAIIVGNIKIRDTIKSVGCICEF
jgi:serine acetyltransferase